MAETKQQTSPSYITPDACPPDIKNGGYLSFTSDEGSTIYVQVTNDLNIWFKNVSKEGFTLNSTSFNGEAAQKLIEYIKFREKMVKEGGEINNNTVSAIAE